jgi:hypothetical protein
MNMNMMRVPSPSSKLDKVSVNMEMRSIGNRASILGSLILIIILKSIRILSFRIENSLMCHSLLGSRFQRLF